MSLGLIGKKIGMTRVFTAAGASRAVTVIEATPNRITQVKTAPTDGYDAVQVTVGARRARRVGKAMQGHFAKAGVEPGRGVWEFRLTQPAAEIALSAPAPQEQADASLNEQAAEQAADQSDEQAATPASDNPDNPDDAADNIADNAADNATDNATDEKAPVTLAAGAELTVALFSAGQKVDVTGRSIGKGFAGVVKRYGFRGGRASHGTSKAHRSGGSIGNAQDPGRIFKGKKMAGHMGDLRRAQQGLVVVRVDAARNLLLISGSIPGSKGSDVIIQPSVKARNSSNA